MARIFWQLNCIYQGPTAASAARPPLAGGPSGGGQSAQCQQAHSEAGPYDFTLKRE